MLILWMLSWEIHWLLSCVDFMDVIMGEYTGYFHVLISWMLSWEIHVYPCRKKRDLGLI